MFIILLAIFAGLAIADNALTLYGIKHLGFREKNPIMRPIVKIPWLSWIVVAVLIAVVGLWCYWLCGLSHWGGIGVLILACVLKSLPVINNAILHIRHKEK